jgi:hypothetical protein
MIGCVEINCSTGTAGKACRLSIPYLVHNCNNRLLYEQQYLNGYLYDRYSLPSTIWAQCLVSRCQNIMVLGEADGNTPKILSPSSKDSGRLHAIHHQYLTYSSTIACRSAANVSSSAATSISPPVSPYSKVEKALRRSVPLSEFGNHAS